MQRFKFVFLATVLLAGCGVQKAEAPRDHVVAVALRSFPKQDWRLTNNRFFLWRKDMTPRQVSIANKIGREIDKYDTQGIPFSRAALELTNKIEPIQEQIEKDEEEVKTLTPQIEKFGPLRIAAEAAVKESETKLAEEKAKPMPNAEVVTQLESQLGTAKQTLAKIDAELAPLEKKRTELQTSIEQKKKTIEPLQTELETVQTKALEIEAKGREEIEKLTTVVDYYTEQPNSVTFQYVKDEKGAERLTASIGNWNMGDDLGARNYSTEAAEGYKPTMGNVTYQELGGVYEFDVYVYTDEAQKNLRETFHFKIARTKYEEPEGGRVFFTGDIVRTSANGEVRRGIAKLVDRNN